MLVPSCGCYMCEFESSCGNIVCSFSLSSSPQPGLTVKDRKWGRGGYNKVTTPTFTETTPTPEVMEEQVDSGGVDERGRETTPTVGVSILTLF